MHKLLWLLLLTFSWTFGQTGWRSIAPGQNVHFTDIYFHNSSDGYAVSPYLTTSILKTTDSGENWSVQSIGGNSPVTIDFYNSSFGFASAYGYPGFSTQDGGANWAVRNRSLTAYDCSMVSNYTVILVGSSGNVMRSTDGGVNWTYPSTGNSVQYNSVWFYNTSYGWVCGNDGVVCRSTDGGVNWTSYSVTQTAPALHEMQSIFFISQTVGWCVGVFSSGYAPIFKTTDGGTTWVKKSQSLTTQQLNGVFFSDASNGWAVGNAGVILHTTDGGETWATQQSGTSQNLNEVFFTNSTYGWIVGDNGVILRTTDGGMPVELVSFTANITNGIVELNWNTATEVNNYGFEVERKSENADWVTLGFVPGNGNCNSERYYSFTDKLHAHGEYIYRLRQIDTDGMYEYSDEVSVHIVPEDYLIRAQNYPNPFNPVTTIEYYLPDAGLVDITVLNVLGGKVKTLFSGMKQAGRQEVIFRGDELSAGVYICRIQSRQQISYIKMVLNK